MKPLKTTCSCDKECNCRRRKDEKSVSTICIISMCAMHKTSCADMKPVGIVKEEYFGNDSHVADLLLLN
jgi:hypothetical protein